MRFNYKNFLAGVAVGAVALNAAPSIADVVYNITPNPFRITVNQDEKEIEGYNINGSTYFKLRDIGEQVGFGVDFKENTIMITTDNTNSKDGATPDVVANATGDTEEPLGYYDLVFSQFSHAFVDYNGEKYMDAAKLSLVTVLGGELDTQRKVSVLKFEYPDDRSVHLINSKSGEILSDPVPLYDVPWLGDERTLPFIKFSDFETHIKPHIDKILDEYGIPK